MQTLNRGDYTISGCELVAEGADLRVQVLTLAAGQCVPWHYHTEISDSFVCLEGPMVVETRAPRHVYRLLPGERCAVPPKSAHYATARPAAPADFSSCRVSASTTSWRSADVLGSPHFRRCERSPILFPAERKHQ
jgi:quercetin dioxygenase-like cupin family protein